MHLTTGKNLPAYPRLAASCGTSYSWSLWVVFKFFGFGPEMRVRRLQNPTKRNNKLPVLSPGNFCRPRLLFVFGKSKFIEALLPKISCSSTVDLSWFPVSAPFPLFSRTLSQKEGCVGFTRGSSSPIAIDSQGHPHIAPISS